MGCLQEVSLFSPISSQIVFCTKFHVYDKEPAQLECIASTIKASPLKGNGRGRTGHKLAHVCFVKIHILKNNFII